MTLACLTKFHGRFLLLFAAKDLAFFGNARMGHDRGQLLLVVRRVGGAVEGGALNFVMHALLQFAHGWHHHVLIQHIVHSPLTFAALPLRAPRCKLSTMASTTDSV